MGIGDHLVHLDQDSYSKDAVLTTSYADDYITRGKGFQVQKRVTLSGSQTLYIEFNTALASGLMVYSLPMNITPNQGNVFLDTYNVDSTTGGSVYTVPLNLNALSDNQSVVTIKYGITTSGTITNLREYSFGAPLTNQSSGGGTTAGDSPKILDNTKPLILKLMNQETETVVLDVNAVWYEIEV